MQMMGFDKMVGRDGRRRPKERDAQPVSAETEARARHTSIGYFCHRIDE